ncbi:FitA-like ribbon-helix-helix domain-containing protein [Salinisphaera orenii]|uniref:DNA-binding protein n=1 Tax=Salinisphaera orenii YIM 95161 TaxID=1051139 RepID=A0A423PDS8_9GAMM|nr:Arc family DNA-binding protein [Salinisphaera halophila]ROO23734.1 DNA-binding protein [Salinisphaera halophila YIM 95161]
MSTLIVKNLPDDLHERLRQLAKRNHRSVTKQVIHIIESSLSGQSEPINRPSSITVQGGRPMSRKELETALDDARYRHYPSLDHLNAHMDELRADRDDIAR